MKILIAYDGSKDAESAIDDLPCAGLPTKGLAKVVSIAEVWLPPPASTPDESIATESEFLHDSARAAQMKGEREVGEAEILAKFGADRVRNMLPGWSIQSHASYGSPGWEIVAEAENFGADLIVVGAQGHSFLGRLMLGSISQRVLTEAACSVRIGRGRIDLDSGPQRVLIGFDGSPGALAAVNSVAERNWSSGSEVRLVAVTDPVMPTAIGRFVPPVVRAVAEIDISERAWLERSAEKALTTLRERRLATTFNVTTGNPKQVLIDEAELFGADSIFVGANVHGGRLERLLLGSTSAAVAARANCSVEVVRAKLETTSPLTGSAGTSPTKLNGFGQDVKK